MYSPCQYGISHHFPQGWLRQGLTKQTNYASGKSPSTISHDLKEKFQTPSWNQMHTWYIYQSRSLGSLTCGYHFFSTFLEQTSPKFRKTLVNIANYFVVGEVCSIRKMEPIVSLPCLASEMYLDIGIWPKSSHQYPLAKVFLAGTSGGTLRDSEME